MGYFQERPPYFAVAYRDEKTDRWTSAVYPQSCYSIWPYVDPLFLTAGHVGSPQARRESDEWLEDRIIAREWLREWVKNEDLLPLESRDHIQELVLGWLNDKKV